MDFNADVGVKISELNILTLPSLYILNCLLQTNRHISKYIINIHTRNDNNYYRPHLYYKLATHNK